MAIVTVFLDSVERRFSVPAILFQVVARSLGQGWSNAIAGGQSVAVLIQARTTAG